MSLAVVLDSDGLIKLGKGGVLEVVVAAWRCLVPRAVYIETVERGMQGGYPDAQVIRDILPPSIVRPRVRHPRATKLLEQREGLGAGEREALHLFFATDADALITDDVAFLALLIEAGVPYLLPASVLIRLCDQGQVGVQAALEGLERMRPLIRPEVYQVARTDLEVFRGKGGAPA